MSVKYIIAADSSSLQTIVDGIDSAMGYPNSSGTLTYTTVEKSYTEDKWAFLFEPSVQQYIPQSYLDTAVDALPDGWYEPSPGE